MEGLNKEQINELNEILKLPSEKQQVKLQEFLKKLTPEQIDTLKQKQNQQCPFCLIADNKINAKKVYEDENVICVLDINPASRGHTILFPRKHYGLLENMENDEIAYLFKIANNIIKTFKFFNAEGANIFVADGYVAGQNVQHTIVHLIPRFKDDNINFGWKSIKLEDNEMDNIAGIIKSNVKIDNKEIEDNEDINEEPIDEEDERVP